ncbi:hypothetical protein LEL_04901 [Akanthomyces lecanii RCEF 1005]|uniref:Uncharacterized protein n=1 Tax=Akanthomyces lecanii RCEF 1005 TaxID=1081108 RepID=A0A162KPS8_CORDF|nr:hypothetical protein LEL_04901 [Akanthomyces lecanii RCEF 1005]
MKFTTVFATLAAFTGSAAAAAIDMRDTCLAKNAVCYVAGGPSPGVCCDGLICAADRCRDPAEETIKPKPTTTAVSEPTCLAKYAVCYVAGGLPPGACCEGLICAADRCRDPAEEEVKPTPTPEPTCLAKNAVCYIAGGPSPGACCDGLICAADRCRDPADETSA